MDLTLLLKYLGHEANESEVSEVEQWLADDPDGSHSDLFSDAHDIFNGMTLYPQKQPPYYLSRKVTPKWRKPLLRAAYAAAALAAVLVALRYGEEKAYRQICSVNETMTVPVGNYLEYTFEDGTRAWMNSGTKVTYPKIFNKESREICVEKGEVLLEVAKDANRPFTVKTFAADVKVHGTRFDVMAYPDQGLFKTSLFCGSVGVIPKGDSEEIALAPGQTLTLDANGTFVKGKFTQDNNLDSWTYGMINIADVGFEELMARLEKAFGITIIIQRETMPEINLTRGRVRVNDGIDHALDVMRLAADFTYEHDYNTNTIIIK